MASIDEKLWDRLRRMKDPGSRRDIVSLGLVKDLQLRGGVVTVHLTPPSNDAYRHEALAAAIRRELHELEGIDKAIVTWAMPRARDREDGSSAMAPLHLPVLDSGIMPGPDAMDASLGRADLAPEAGYGEWGPQQLPSPEASIPHDRYEGWPPVYQWEIDPADPSLISGEAHTKLGDWEYDIWWQAHPSDLVYASIQALRDDTVTAGPERQHPMGRNVAVNLVYDRRRAAVVAVYGTARDFRPFIEAFRMGCNLEEHAKESNE